MGNWYNAHRDGIDNTGSREYERAVTEMERRAYARLASSNSGDDVLCSNNNNSNKTVEGVKNGKAEVSKL